MLHLEVALHGVGHVVESLTQLAQVIVAGDAGARGEVSVGDGFGGVGDALDGAGERARDEHAHDACQRDGCAGSGHDGAVGILAKHGVALGEQGV